MRGGFCVIRGGFCVTRGGFCVIILGEGFFL